MNKGSLFSDQWHRVRDVCPQLSADVTVSRHIYRGRIAYVLQRPGTTLCHRLDVLSFELVDRLDGETSVGQLWEQAIIDRDHAAPTQDDWIRLLGELHAAELIVVDRRVSEDRLFDQRQRSISSERRQRYLNPLYLRFALHDPNIWLSRLEPLSRRLFSRTAWLLWLFIMILATISVVSHGESLWLAMTSDSVLNAQNTLLFFLIYPALKLIHELAHALAVKRAGGDVHETGIALMVLLPLPYVDASASALFPDKYDRMIVSSAGIVVELACAAVGVLLWANTNGTLQDVGLVMFMIGSISTLLLNGNPLLKFDGYYVLADWLEMPNLATRARRAVLDRLSTIVSGEPAPAAREEDYLERIWLYTYGVCSATYRTALMLSIAWMLSERWFFLGIVLACIVIVLAVMLPLWKMLCALLSNPVYRSGRSVLLAGALPVLLITLGFTLPVPYSNVVPGVIWLPEEAVVRVSSECDIVEVFSSPGSMVKAGDDLLSCEEPGAVAKFSEMVARVDELQVRRAGAAARDPLSLSTLDAELKASTAVLQDMRERINANRLRAQLDGLFDAVDTSALQGRSLARGDVVGYVIPSSNRTVRLAIDERWISRFDKHLQSIALRVSAADGQTRIYDTRVLQRTPKATRVVASAALSSIGGGLFAADENGDGHLLKEAVFDVELEWPEVAGSAAVGSHVGVRLEYTPTPLSERLGSTLRLAFSDRIES